MLCVTAVDLYRCTDTQLQSDEHSELSPLMRPDATQKDKTEIEVSEREKLMIR
jgi:hypothetical protein